MTQASYEWLWKGLDNKSLRNKNHANLHNSYAKVSHFSYMEGRNQCRRQRRKKSGRRKEQSQESGLNRGLAGNNNQCKVISVSDTVTSTGGKES